MPTGLRPSAVDMTALAPFVWHVMPVLNLVVCDWLFWPACQHGPMYY